MTQIERAYKALANKRRLTILQLLHTRGSVNVSDIADHIHLSLPSTSRHLRTLALADFVQNEQTNTTVRYFLSKERDTLLDHTLKLLR